MPSLCKLRASSRKGLFAVVAFVTLASIAGAEPWPRFRGPNGQGVSTETGLPTKWTVDSALWKVKLPGGGFSSPVVWGDTVFVTAADESAEKGYLAAYLTSNGRRLWQCEFDLPRYRMNALNDAASVLARRRCRPRRRRLGDPVEPASGRVRPHGLAPLEARLRAHQHPSWPDDHADPREGPGRLSPRNRSKRRPPSPSIAAGSPSMPPPAKSSGPASASTAAAIRIRRRASSSRGARLS